MGIEQIIQPAEETPVDDIVDALDEGADDGGTQVVEPIDEADFPDTFDDDEEVKNPHLVALLREQVLTEKRKRQQLEARLTAPRVTRTPKPTMDSCEYDEDRFEAELLAWKDNEAKADEQDSLPAPATSTIQDDFKQDFQRYQAGVQKLAKDDFEVAQKAVTEALTPDQQSAILMAVKDPTRFFYALGKSPMRLAQLGSISNPFKLAAEAARLEGVRTMPRKEPANIDAPLRGSGRLSVESSDKKEDALMKEVARTGDIDKLRAYRREQREKAA